MFLSVKELELRKVRFEVSFAPGQLDLLDPGVKLAQSLIVRGSAELAGPLADIRVRGHIQGELDCECDRCLESFPFRLDGDFDLSYSPVEGEADGPAEREIDRTEAEAGYYEGAGLELAEVIREQVLLWLPMQRSCRPECRGICPYCGQNRNEGDCGCRNGQADDRWAALKKMSGA
jgi:uncharacterized protein